MYMYVCTFGISTDCHSWEQGSVDVGDLRTISYNIKKTGCWKVQKVFLLHFMRVNNYITNRNDYHVLATDGLG